MSKPAQYLIQLLLPLKDNTGRTFPPRVWSEVKGILVEQFGGVTAYTRSPAEGVWAPTQGEEWHDEIFIVEVIAEELDRKWWANVRLTLQADLRQERLLIRAIPITAL